MTLEEVTGTIAKRAAKFKADYGIEPFDVVLGPNEFGLLAEQSKLTDADISSRYRLEMAKHFHNGMRVRLASSDGILVGCLTAKEL